MHQLFGAAGQIGSGHGCYHQPPTRGKTTIMDDEDYLFQVLESDRLPTLEEDRGWIHQRLVRQLRGGAKKARQA
jgi:hypothetical protein